MSCWGTLISGSRMVLWDGSTAVVRAITGVTYCGDAVVVSATFDLHRHGMQFVFQGVVNFYPTLTELRTFAARNHKSYRFDVRDIRPPRPQHKPLVQLSAVCDSPVLCS